MGPSLGLFSLGAFFPWVNSIGALTGFLSGLGSAIWLYGKIIFLEIYFL